jgi:plastocyanin
MPRPPAAAFVLLATAVAGLSGCGGDEPTATASSGTLRLRLDEYRVLPERVRVPAGRVRIVARNTGRLTHNVAVVQFERPLGDEQEREYARTETAHPRHTVSTTVRLRPGRYRIICTIANHDNLGQYGELRVSGR